MTKKEESESKPIVLRTSAGLRDALFDELDSLRNGRSNAAVANATAKIAGAIVSTVEMEIEVHKIVSKNPPTKQQLGTLPPLQLTTPSA